MTRASCRPVMEQDREAWLGMRAALWPGDEDEHRENIAGFLAGDRHQPAEVLLAWIDKGPPVGFVELSIRNIVDGCETDRVGYLEGWYVIPEARRQGIGSALVRAGEDWARAQGCVEFASDAVLENEISHRAHRALGFEETDRVVNYRKRLTNGPAR